jgi:hypothetical protein
MKHERFKPPIPGQIQMELSDDIIPAPEAALPPNISLPEFARTKLAELRDVLGAAMLSGGTDRYGRWTLNGELRNADQVRRALSAIVAKASVGQLITPEEAKDLIDWMGLVRASQKTKPERDYTITTSDGRNYLDRQSAAAGDYLDPDY